MCHAERMPALCRTLRQFFQIRRRSRHSVASPTAASGTPCAAPRLRSVPAQNTSSAFFITGQPSSYNGSLVRRRMRMRARVPPPSASSPEKVMSPANMCPSGVMNVNDSSSAYSTMTPVARESP